VDDFFRASKKESDTTYQEKRCTSVLDNISHYGGKKHCRKWGGEDDQERKRGLTCELVIKIRNHPQKGKSVESS